MCEFALGGAGRKMALAAFWSSLKTGRTGLARARNEPQRAGLIFWASRSSACGRLGRRACEERAVKAPQPVSLEGLPASKLSLCFLYGRGDCLCLEFASVVVPGYVWLCARYCKGASRGSRPASR